MTQALSGPVEQHVTAAAVITVMATVLFALLLRDAVVVQLAQQLGADPFKQYLLVAIMGVAGAIGCLLAAAEPQTFRPQWSLAGGFAVSAAAMLAALLVNSWERLVVFSGVAALAAGWVAVVLSMVLRPAIGSEKLGMWIGVGVGLAFALFSLPQIYLAAAAVPALVAAAAAAAGMVAAVALRPRFAATSFSPDYQSRVWLAWIVMLLVLVWMDKAALFVIRGATVQHEFQWDGWWSQGSTACLHFLIAALAGAAFDRGWAAGMLLLAMVLLLAACNLSQADPKPTRRHRFSMPSAPPSM